MKKIMIIIIIVISISSIIIHNKYIKYKMSLLIPATGKEKFVMIEKLIPIISSELNIGMTKTDVLKIIGKPQNVDSYNIWYWSYSNKFNKKWIELYWGDRTGYYIIFINDKLISNIYNICDVNPASFLRNNKGYSKNKTEKIIGLYDIDDR